MASEHFITTEDLNSLHPLLRELLIGEELDTIPTDICIKLGDNVIYFLALLFFNQYINKKSNNSDIESYIKDYLLSDQRGLDTDLAISIIHKSNVIDPGQNLIKNISNVEINIEQWINLRKTIHNTVNPKILGVKLREKIFNIVENIFNNVLVFHGTQSFNDDTFTFESNKISFSILPLFLVCECAQCAKKHLFAFNSYNAAFDHYLFKCWGNRHILIIDNISHSVLFKKIQIIGKKNNVIKSSSQYSSYLPMFSSFNKPIQKLVELLSSDQTQESTKNILWLSKTTPSNTYNYPILVKNRILLDCVEHGPIEVLRKVAYLEGVDELPGYVEKLLTDLNKSRDEIKNVKNELEKEWKRIARKRYAFKGRDFTINHKDPEFIKIRNDIYSRKVAELLEFNIEKIDNITHLEDYCDKINKDIDYYENTKSDLMPDSKEGAKNLFLELEFVYKELLSFYRYIYDVEIKGNSQPSTRVNMLSDFIQLHFELLELHKNFSCLKGKQKEEEKFERLLGNRNDSKGELAVFDMDNYLNIIEGKNENENLLNFKIELLKKDKTVNPYLSEDTKESYLVILHRVKELYDFFSNPQNRIFPHKIYFTVTSEIRPFSGSDDMKHGIRTCHYFSYIKGINVDGKASAMKIYTEKEDVSLADCYYCVPHRSRSTDNFWVEPFLVPIRNIEDRSILESGVPIIDQIDQDKPYIFISYSYKDYKDIKPDLEFFNQKGYEIWFDRFDKGIPAGVDWDEYIKIKQENCTQYLIYISKNSNASREVGIELDRAGVEGFNKPILAIELEKLSKTEKKGKILALESNQGIRKFIYSDEEYKEELINKLDIKCLKINSVK